jgi:[ribosomal protein S18]-alanine N-acetyltransferase
MKLRLAPISAGDVRQIRAWRYPEPYAVYNLASADEEADLRYFLDPANDFHSVYDSTDELVGFCSFGSDAQVPGGDYSAQALDVGLGLRPDHTGQGLGMTFLGAILEFAQRVYEPHQFRATVAAFNHRSRRVFERHGFVIVQTFLSRHQPPTEFHVLLR